MTDQIVRVILQGDGAQLTAVSNRGVSDLQKLGAAGEAAGRSVASGSQAAVLSMRQISPQLTDIATQLAGGQSPFLVLLQQGGQLKDMAGGMGPLWASVRAAVSPAAVGLGAAAAAIVAIGAAAVQSYRDAAAFRDMLALTGNASGLTADSFRLLGSQVAEAAQTTQGDARTIVKAMADTGQIGSGAMGALGTAIARVAEVTGKSASEVAADFSGMSKGVTDWAIKHNEAWHFATASQVDYLRQLEQTGQQQQAMIAVGDMLTQHLAGQQQQLGYLERAWNSVTKAINDAWTASKDAVLNIGRPDSLSGQLSAAQAALDAAERRYPKGIRGAYGQAEINSYRGAVDAANKRLLRDVDNAGMSAYQAQEEQARIKRLEDLRGITEKLSGASLEYARTVKTIQDAYEAGQISDQRRIDMLTQTANRYGAGIKTPKAPKPEQPDKSDPLGDFIADKLVWFNERDRKRQETERVSASAADFAAQMQEQTAQLRAGLITDETERAKALLEIDRQGYQSRIDEFAAYGADVREAQNSLANWVVARQAKIAEDAKPAWQKMIEGWADAGRTMGAAYDSAITSALEGSAQQLGRWATGQGGSLKGLAQQISGDLVTAQIKVAIGQSGIGDWLKGVTGATADAGLAVAGATLTTAGASLTLSATTSSAALVTAATGLGAAATALQSAAVTLSRVGGIGGGGGSGGGVSSIITDALSIIGIESAKGNVFKSAGLHAYANQVVDRPTLFPFAKGVGLMGEAGPEAIMPLRRGPGGRLGVEAHGSSGPSITIHSRPVIQIDARSDQAQVARLVSTALDQRDRALLKTLKSQGVL